MSIIVSDPTAAQGSGPENFEAAKRARVDGSEYWSARDLMILMGYSADWRRFRLPIEKAMRSAVASGAAADFRQVYGSPANNLGGRPAEDYELDREAAYLVAMNGDENKPQVAQAQAYFAARTRQAEVAENELSGQPQWVLAQIQTLLQIGRVETEVKRQNDELLKHADELLRHNGELSVLRAQVDDLQDTTDEWTARAFLINNNLPADDASCRALGKATSQLMRERGIDKHSRPDKKWGAVGIYPLDVLREALLELGY